MAGRSRIKIKGPKNLRQEIHKRARAAAQVAGRALAEGLRDEVLSRIPDNEPWLKLYRGALTYLESKDGTQWAIAGISPTKLTTVPAETTQIKLKGFEGGADATLPIGRFLASHNPWTVDTLPSIAPAIPASAEVRPASAKEMEAHRTRLNAALPDILAQLEAAGASVTNDFPKIAGEVYMDLVFLQMRLEHGLGGFRRIPHWRPALRGAKNAAPGLVLAREKEIKAALAGKPLPNVDTMSRSEEMRLEKRRKQSW